MGDGRGLAHKDDTDLDRKIEKVKGKLATATFRDGDLLLEKEYTESIEKLIKQKQRLKKSGRQLTIKILIFIFNDFKVFRIIFFYDFCKFINYI